MAESQSKDILHHSNAFNYAGFETINDKVLREMNERAKKINSAQFTIGTGPSQRTPTTSPLKSGSSALAFQAAAAKTSPRATRRGCHKRYSSIHRRNFAKLESIATHYAVTCRPPHPDNRAPPNEFSIGSECNKPDNDDTPKDNGKRMTGFHISSQTPTKKRRLQGPKLQSIASQSNLKNLTNDASEPLKRDNSSGIGSHSYNNSRDTLHNTNNISTLGVNDSRPGTQSRTNINPNSRNPAKLRSCHSSIKPQGKVIQNPSCPSISDSKLGHSKNSTLFKSTAASRIRSSASMSSLKSAADKEKPTTSMSSLKSVLDKEQPATTKTKELCPSKPLPIALSSSSSSASLSSGLALASSNRVEQLLNTLAPTPGKRSLKETKKIIDQLPSADAQNPAKTPVRAQHYSTKIPRSSSQAQLKYSSNVIKSSKTSGSAKGMATPTERLRRSKILARSSPNLKSFR